MVIFTGHFAGGGDLRAGKNQVLLGFGGGGYILADDDDRVFGSDCQFVSSPCRSRSRHAGAGGRNHAGSSSRGEIHERQGIRYGVMSLGLRILPVR